MAKRRKNITNKSGIREGFCQNRAKARKINASTPYETCSEQLKSAFLKGCFFFDCN
jgi:hypothetical protein